MLATYGYICSVYIYIVAFIYIYIYKLMMKKMMNSNAKSVE